MLLSTVVTDSTFVKNITTTKNTFADMVKEGRFEDLGSHFITSKLSPK